jgi:hypothetical protein
VISLQHWRDTCRAIENIRTELVRVHTEVLPQARNSIQRSTESCERSIELNKASTRRLLDPAGDSRQSMRRARVVGSRR